jgi:hypothetical protein
MCELDRRIFCFKTLRVRCVNKWERVWRSGGFCVSSECELVFCRVSKRREMSVGLHLTKCLESFLGTLISHLSAKINNAWRYSSTPDVFSWCGIYCRERTPSCACNETSLMHYLSSVYSVTILVHVFGLASCPSSGGNNVYMWQLVRVVRVSRLSEGQLGMELAYIEMHGQQHIKKTTSSLRLPWNFIQCVLY